MVMTFHHSHPDHLDFFHRLTSKTSVQRTAEGWQLSASSTVSPHRAQQTLRLLSGAGDYPPSIFSLSPDAPCSPAPGTIYYGGGV